MNYSVSNASLRILVTRPQHQAHRLCGLLEAAGHECIRLPTIDILPVADVGSLAAHIDALQQYDLAVFVSINAVKSALKAILDRRAWPAQTRIASVGARSAEALSEFGLSVDLLPEHQFNSEALLALAALQDMRGRQVVIFRGNGGREHLRDTLLQRGATVDYVEVYRRACPDVEATQLQHLWQPGYLDYISISSNEALQNLLAMAGETARPSLLQIPLLVIGERQVLLAKQLGFTCTPRVAAQASDEAIVAALA